MMTLLALIFAIDAGLMWLVNDLLEERGYTREKIGTVLSGVIAVSGVLAVALTWDVIDIIEGESPMKFFGYEIFRFSHPQLDDVLVKFVLWSWACAGAVILTFLSILLSRSRYGTLSAQNREGMLGLVVQILGILASLLGIVGFFIQLRG